MDKVIRGTFVVFIIGVLVGTASFASYHFINTGIKDGLSLFGINNFYLQTGIIILGVVAILLILGYGFGKAMKQILKV